MPVADAPAPERSVLCIDRSGALDVRREPAPAPGRGEILVRVRASLVSPGTELGPYRGKQRTAAAHGEGKPFGYQCAGDVIALGEGCRGFQIGDRVACMGGGYALHASVAAVPQLLATPLPAELPYEHGAFAALAPTAMHAVRRGEVAFGDAVGVLGLGLVGALTAQVCHIAGARVVAFDPLPLRARLARETGIEHACTETGDAAVARTAEITEGRGLDCAFLALTGDATAALDDAVCMMHEAPDTHRWGRIVLVGGATVTHAFGAALGNLDLRSAARTGPGYHDDAYERGADYPRVFVRWTTQEHLKLFVRWLQEGVLRVEPLITDRVILAEAPAACAALMDNPGEHLGVVITYP